MKYLILTVSLFSTTLVFAKTKNFEVKINEVSVNGSLQAQPRKLRVKPDQMVVISRSVNSDGVNTVVEMTVTDDSTKIKDGILIKLSIVEEKDGERKLIGTPQMLVKSGAKAEMTQGQEGETPFIKASLTGTRIQ